VYIGAAHPGGARVAAVDITKRVGPVIWEFMTLGAMSAAPALYDNVIFVGGEDNRVYAVSTSRRPVWGLDGFSFETSGRIVADLAADEYAVYVASTDTKLYALDRMSGKIKWTYYAERALTAPPFVTADSVYEYVPGKGLVALDKTTGSYYRTPRWTAPEAVQVVSVGARRVYVKLKDGRIGALDRQTGESLWHGTWQYAKFAVNTEDPTIYAATEDGKVYSYMPSGETTAPKSTAKPVVLSTRPATTNGAQQTAPAPANP
jgi:outer membrane protein assembly factor BamB